jgi:hypothetical protein
MKLLSKNEAQANKKRENEGLIESNIKLRKFYKEITDKIRGAKTDYSGDKLIALESFDRFVSELNEKKSKLLQEYNSIVKAIEDKKEIYYGLIVKQDELEERVYQADEREKKLDLREEFINELERKWTTKTK